LVLLAAVSAGALVLAGSGGATVARPVHTVLTTRQPIFAFAQGSDQVTWIDRAKRGQQTGCAMDVRRLGRRRTGVYPLPSCALLLRSVPLALANGEAGWSTDYDHCPTLECKWKVVGISANPNHREFSYAVSVPCIVVYPDKCGTETGTSPIVRGAGSLLAYNADGVGKPQAGERERVDVLVGGVARRLLAVDGVIQGLQVGGGVIQTINQVCTPNCGSHSLGTGLFTASGKPLAKLAPSPVVLAGNIAAVLNTAAGEISLYNAFTGTQLASVAVANANNVSLVGGDTQWLVFHIGRAISALNVNTHQIVPLTRTAPNPLDVSLSGHRVAWAENIHGHGRIRALQLPN